MNGPFKLKYKNSAFPFKGDGKKKGDTLLKRDNPNLPDLNKEIWQDIYNKLDYPDKSDIPYKDLQKAYFEQQRREKEHELKQKNKPRSA